MSDKSMREMVEDQVAAEDERDQEPEGTATIGSDPAGGVGGGSFGMSQSGGISSAQSLDAQMSQQRAQPVEGEAVGTADEPATAANVDESVPDDPALASVDPEEVDN